MSESNSSRPVCLITGGSSGIGLAVAKMFAKGGYDLSICGRDQDKLVAAKNAIAEAAGDPNLKLTAFQVDLVVHDEAKALGIRTIEEFGRIDVLVNNAAYAPLAEFEKIDPETFERTINICIRSFFYLTQYVWEQMKQRETGSVVNISSLAAVDPFPGFSLYGACKAWMDLLTHALAAEGKESGLRICSVRPGAVETPMLRGLFPDFPPEQCVQPADVAQLVWDCVADPENYPSGQAFPITKQ